MSNDPKFDEQQKADAEQAERLGAHVELTADVAQAEDREGQTWTVYFDGKGERHRVHSETYAELVAKGDA